MYRDYLVLGSGIAGLKAAEAIRDLDANGSVMMVTRDSVSPYSRPMLTKTPLRTFCKARISLFPEIWYQERRIELSLNTAVETIHAETHTVIAGGKEIRYGKCIYALGAENFIPPVPGARKDNVVSIRTAEDIEHIKKYAANAREAVVIGGGVIGLEAAFELSHYGLSVTVLEALPFLMPRLLDPGTAHDLKEGIHRFSIYTDVKISEICGEKAAEAVCLEDGRMFPCGLVIVSCGVRANIKIAQEAGIACERSVVVNKSMETNIPDIYACGDCAQFGGVNSALWSQAVEEGKTAGANAAGVKQEFAGFDTSLILNNPEISLFAYGDLGKNPKVTYWCEAKEHEESRGFFVNPAVGGMRQRLFYRQHKLVGISLLGNLSEMEELKKQVAGGDVK